MSLDEGEKGDGGNKKSGGRGRGERIDVFWGGDEEETGWRRKQEKR